MAQLRQDYAEFDKRQTQVIVVGPENAKAFAAYSEQHDLPFIGLPDPKASVLKLYGQEVNLFKLGRMPAQVIVDKPAWLALSTTGIPCRISRKMRNCSPSWMSSTRLLKPNKVIVYRRCMGEGEVLATDKLDKSDEKNDHIHIGVSVVLTWMIINFFSYQHLQLHASEGVNVITRMKGTIISSDGLEG